MNYNPYYLYPFTFLPPLPNDLNKPPTIYSILNSICNYEKEEYTKIRNLAKVGRTKIFDFEYELDESVSKEEFETNILNHFMQRRIGFETITAFLIQLETKLHEIMPMYNKMFHLLAQANSFGNIMVKEGTSNRKIENKENENTNVDINNNSTSDRRYSDTPENRINDIKNGNYVTDYNYDENNDTQNTKGNRTNNNDTKDDNIYKETITNVNLIDDMIKINENIKSIYSLIYKDLDCLFYQLV